MAIYVHKTSGNDSWPGNDIDYPVASLTQALTNQPTYSPYNTIIQILDTDTYSENITLTGQTIIGDINKVLSGTGPTLTGAADTDPVVDITTGGLLSGLIVYPSTANKVGVRNRGDCKAILDSVAWYAELDGVILLDIREGFLEFAGINLFIFLDASIPNARFIKINSDSLSVITKCIFVWDSVNGYGAENQIVQDAVVGGSHVVFANCRYVDMDVDAGSYRQLYTSRNTYPTTATTKDPYPLTAFSYQDIIIPTDNDAVADTVWDEAKNEHIVAGSFGKAVGDIDTDIDQSLSTTESNIRGTDGDTLETLSDQLDVVETDTNEIQGKLPTNYIMGSSTKSDKDGTIDAILADTDAIDTRLPTDPADQSQVEAAISTSEGNIRGTDGDDLKSISGQLDSAQSSLTNVLSDTNEIQGKLPTNNIMGSSVKSDKDDDIDAILADTDAIDARLPSDPADESQIESAISAAESNIRGTDGDDLKSLSDQLDTAQSSLTDILADTEAIDTRLPSDPADESIVEDAISAARDSIIVEVGEVAGEVWGYADRTLTDMGSDVAGDVWDYPNRTLTDLGSDVAGDVWSYPERGITTEVLSDGSRLAKADGTKGTDAIYDLVQAFEFEGSEAVTIAVCDTLGSGPIPDARFSLEGVSGNLLEIGWTDTDGSVVLLGNSSSGLPLDPGSYVARFVKALVSFESSYGFTVEASGANDFIFYGSVQTIEPSPDPATCLVYGNLADFKLIAHQDVQVIIHGDILPQNISDTLITNKTYTVLTDENGDFEFYVAQTSTIKVEIDEAGIDHSITIPASGSAKLVDLLE